MTVKSHTTLSVMPLFIALKNNIILPHDNPQLIAIAFIGTLIGAILPDIDEPNSFIGHKFIFFSEPLKMLGIKHRSYTHSLFFPLVIALFGTFHPIFYFIAFGSFMHTMEDMITNSGVYLFYPFYKKRIGIRLFNTGSIFAYLFTFAVSTLVIVYFLYG
jgi:inner membrane protein